MNLKEIANALPGNWTVKDNDELTRADGLKLWVREGGYGMKGRVGVSFMRPRGVRGDWYDLWDNNEKVSDPRITVSATKSSEAIAKDIVRRLLTDAEKVFALATARIKIHADFDSGKKDLLHEVASVFGTKPKTHYSTGEFTGEIDPYVGIKSFGVNGYGNVIVNGPDSIKIELNSMGKDFGMKVVKALAAVIKEEASKAS